MSNKTAKNSKKGKPITSVADAPSHNPLLDDFVTQLRHHIATGEASAQHGTDKLSAKQQSLLHDVLQHFAEGAITYASAALKDVAPASPAPVGDVEPLDRDLANTIVVLQAQSEALKKDIMKGRNETKVKLPTELRHRYSTRSQAARAAVTPILEASAVTLSSKGSLDKSSAVVMGLGITKDIMSEVTISYLDQAKHVDDVIRDTSDTITVSDAVAKVGPATARMDKLMESAPTGKR